MIIEFNLLERIANKLTLKIVLISIDFSTFSPHRVRSCNCHSPIKALRPETKTRKLGRKSTRDARVIAKVCRALPTAREGQSRTPRKCCLALITTTITAFRLMIQLKRTRLRKLLKIGELRDAKFRIT